MRRYDFYFLLTLVAICLACNQPLSSGPPDESLLRAIDSRATRAPVEGEGTVVRLLPDDHEGSRHQRFIVRLRSGHTVLVSHNIDLAPRIERLREGDHVAFSGEYGWNEKGGVVHWTHHDPAGHHKAGWLRHGGEIYQ